MHANTPLRVFLTLLLVLGATPRLSAQSVARLWDEALLDAIRIDFPAPTVHSRNLYHTSAAMYDAWAAFEPAAMGVFASAKYSFPFASSKQDAQNEAISYAAYRVLSTRYDHAINPEANQQRFDQLMSQLGYDPAVTTLDGNSPAAVGNRIAAQILAAGLNDGSNEANGYVDTTGYQPINPPMTVDYPGVVTPDSLPLVDPNRWQPLFIHSAKTQNGLEGTDLQRFVSPHWGGVTTFALGKGTAGPTAWDAIDPGMPPQLNGVGDAQYRADTVAVIRYSNSLDPTQGAGAQQVNISPSVAGNRLLGTHTNRGYDVNPVTGAAYEDNLVTLADYGRVLAEFWADGPQSETPPGHWNVIANQVSDHPLLEKRIGGTGDVVDDLEWDVKLYLALNGAVHDAAVAGWGTKEEYDYVRPITMIRYQGSLGQASDPTLPSYHADGLPLEDGLIELITAESIAPGGRHRNVYDNANQDAHGDFTLNYSESDLVGKIAIHAWNHEPEDPDVELSGTDWILAENWVPYQQDNFVTPAFAAFVSGHSTFSRAAAEVLTELTGSPYFPGGLGEATFEPGFLDFELGPSEPITLQWASYYDAADEAGISRLWGGIHVTADDFNGRIMGSAIGKGAYAQATEFYEVDQPLWHNAATPIDVDDSGSIQEADALLVIKELNERKFTDPITGVIVAEDDIFCDTSNDGFIVPFDALLVINQLNAPQPEGEFAGSRALAANAVPEPTGCWLSVTLLWSASCLSIYRRRR